ncbi:MAG: helix-turn-helix domain-containing protein [Bacteroides sp.]|nr:helix-turn-helix domain-containing protein [Prevotella sp.]MCM1408769.1 helix-turn-helix domain-containing protein [Treponema brennaborense]MCM1470684.1 helix-turn-helix domain-containing protein [Bacteroides sp.]
MNFLIFSNQKEFSLSMAAKFSKGMDRCILAENIIQMHNFFMTDNIDFIIMTKGIIPDSLMSIYKHIHKHQRIIPLTLIDLNKLPVSAEFITEQLTHELSNSEIEKLADTISYIAERINSYCPIEALLAPDAESAPAAQIKLRTVIKKLLQFFYNNKDKEVTLNEIATHIWGSISNARKKTLYSYIHELRNILEENPRYPTKIIRIDKGTYKFSD